MSLPMLRMSFPDAPSLANSYSSLRTLSSYHLTREGYFDCLTQPPQSWNKGPSGDTQCPLPPPLLHMSL